jgi:hypothetical protein
MTTPEQAYSPRDFKGAIYMQSAATYTAARSYIDGADFACVEMGRKWGEGRLRLVITPSLREKFDRQWLLFNEAIRFGDLEAVRIQSARMVRAWEAADREAVSLGVKPLAPEVWETCTDDGEVLAIVRTRDEASKVIAEGRAVRVVTLEEVGRLLGSHYGQVLDVLTAFKGSRVVAVREPVPVNLVDAFDHKRGGDDLPDHLKPTRTPNQMATQLREMGT